MCAGVTTLQCLRNSGARPARSSRYSGQAGSVISEFSSRPRWDSDRRIARGNEKEPFAKKLGAHHYIDSRNTGSRCRALKFGGAKVILATVTNAKAMNAAAGGLAVNGTLMLSGSPLAAGCSSAASD